MRATSTLIAHFWHYYFLPTGEPWWKGAVWGNVIAILPSAPILLLAGMAAYFFHKRALAPLHAKLAALEATHKDHHEEHIALLAGVLDALDPDTDGGISDLRERLDETTPGGLGAIRERLDKLVPSEP